MDKFFLQPTKLNTSVLKFKVRTGQNDSSYIVKIDTSQQFQPTFLTAQNEPAPLDFHVKSVLFKGANDKLLNGWWLTADENMTKPTIIFFHGNGGSLFSQYPLITPLVRKGFNIFMFDYSGFGYSEGKAKQKNAFKDGIAAINYVSDFLQNKTDNILIYGQSFGGQLSLACYLASNAKNIKGLVVEGTFTSNKAMGKHTAGGFGKMMTKEQFNAKETVKKLQLPLLVIHSEDDEVIPFAMGKEIFENANSPKKFIGINGKHCYGLVLYSDTIVSEIDDLFYKIKITND